MKKTKFIYLSFVLCVSAKLSCKFVLCKFFRHKGRFSRPTALFSFPRQAISHYAPRAALKAHLPFRFLPAARLAGVLALVLASRLSRCSYSPGFDIMASVLSSASSLLSEFSITPRW